MSGVRRTLLAATAFALLACSDSPTNRCPGSSSSLPQLGEPCTLLLCAPTLSCSSKQSCVKSCSCDRDAGVAPVCTPSGPLSVGCPPGAACVVDDREGRGSCVRRCEDGCCPPGEGTCVTAPSGERVCVGGVDAFPWQGLDAK